MEDFDRFNMFQNDEQKGKKKAIVIAIGVCIVLIILLACMIMFYNYMDSKTFKLFVDGQQVSISDDFMITDDNGNVYVKAKELAGLVGWTYQNGEYGAFTEDMDAGYLQNSYEIASFKAESTELKKYIQVSESVLTPPEENKSKNQEGQEEIELPFITVNSPNGTMESFEMSLPVKLSNNQVYIPFAHINDICNCLGTYENYRMNIYEQNYLLRLAMQNAASFGYTNISGVYENVRALAYGMMVVNKDENYGVVSLNSNEQVLGLRYSDIVFNQNVKEFFVKVKNLENENTVGLISADGTVIISPKSYDNISILSDELGLYLIEKDNKYGVINRKGEIVVYDEYDGIGLSEDLLEQYGYTSEDNKYLIYNKAIIVENDGMYGLYNAEGKELLSSIYSLGCDLTAEDLETDDTDEKDSKNDKNSSGASTSTPETLLKIETTVELKNGETVDIQGVVIYSVADNGYGIYDVNSETMLVPCNCRRIYSKTRSGKVTYYMDFGGTEYEFVSTYLQAANGSN